MSAKSKSVSSETPPTTKNPISKTSPATPRVSKLGRNVAKSDTDSPSPVPSLRSSVERSPRSVAAKPTVDRRSPKISTLAEKPAPRGVQKGSELQAQITVLQENLKKAEEKLVLIEKEKEKVITDLKEAQKLSEETNEKLQKAIVAQKNAEENIEIEKFRAVEMEQAGIESAQKKEEKWEKEIETVKNQHAADVAALVSATQELEKVKQELAMTADAKDQALHHADDAAKIAENQMERVETLSNEITRLKGLLNAKFESEADQSNKMITELNLEIENLKSESSRAGKSVSDLKSEIETLKSEGEDNEKLISELKSETETLKLEAEESDKLISELKSEIETLKLEAEENDKLISELKSETDHLKSEETELKSEIETLSQEVRKSKVYKEKLGHIEASFEELNVELEAAKMSESYARSLMEEWKNKVEELDLQAEEAKRLERSANSSLESMVKDLEKSNGFLKKAEIELSDLKEKVGLLEMSNVRQRGDLEETERVLQKVKEEASEMTKKAEFLKTELETVKEEKLQALNNEKLAAESVQNLLEEKNELIGELENSKNEEEKSKKALESLASALHEVSSEARDAKEKLLSNQSENENYEAQIEDLKHVLKTTNEKYQNMLDDAKHEIDMLMNTIEQAKTSRTDTETEWKEKETELTECVNKLKEENERLARLVREAEEEVHDSNEERTQIKNLLKESGSEVDYLKKILGDAKAESMNLKESLMDRENELQSLDQEISDLKTRESESLKKIDELSRLLEEAAVAKEKTTGNVFNDDVSDDVSESEKDYDVLPKVVEFSEHNGDIPKTEQQQQPMKETHTQTPLTENEVLVKETKTVVKDLNGEHNESEKVTEKGTDPEEIEFKMWESCKIEEKDLSPERETVNDESFEDEVDSKTENGLENVENGNGSPLKEVKKKKPLLKKFGSLLKSKKGSSNNQK